jgi:tetrahydromethanopterin S-methyltransferase subunit G
VEQVVLPDFLVARERQEEPVQAVLLAPRECQELQEQLEQVEVQALLVKVGPLDLVEELAQVVRRVLVVRLECPEVQGRQAHLEEPVQAVLQVHLAHLAPRECREVRGQRERVVLQDFLVVLEHLEELVQVVLRVLVVLLECREFRELQEQLEQVEVQASRVKAEPLD